MSKFKQSFLTIAIGLALVAGISYAWTGPTANPPKNNAPAPINVRGDDTTTATVDEGFQQFTGTKTLMMGDGTKTLGIVGSIWTNGLINTEGGILTKGGTNKDNLQSRFPYWIDGKNYIRGTTIIAENDTNNFVGIGTSNPQAKLHVEGVSIFKGGTNKDGFTSFFPNANGNNYVRGKTIFADGGIKTDTDRSNNRVGIGTANPQAKLDIATNDPENKEWALRVKDGSDVPNGYVLTSFTEGSVDGLVSWAPAPSGGGGGNTGNDVWVGTKFVPNGTIISCKSEKRYWGKDMWEQMEYLAKAENSKIYMQMIHTSNAVGNSSTGWINDDMIEYADNTGLNTVTNKYRTLDELGPNSTPFNDGAERMELKNGGFHVVLTPTVPEITDFRLDFRTICSAKW